MSNNHPDDEAVDILAGLDPTTAGVLWSLAHKIASTTDPATVWAKARGDETPPQTQQAQQQPQPDNSFPDTWPVTGPFTHHPHTTTDDEGIPHGWPVTGPFA